MDSVPKLQPHDSYDGLLRRDKRDSGMNEKDLYFGTDAHERES